ncbi:hypothetical protein DL768_010170 [Monosporascus sp. mg162]|nr:hypothetical protein DL768_010170 [Monosporascus sp. mg162]
MLHPPDVTVDATIDLLLEEPAETMLQPPDVTVDATIGLLLEEPADANATWQLRRTLEDHKCSVMSVAFSHNSKLLASGSADRTVQLWDPATGQLLRTLEGHKSWVESVAFSHDSKLLASGSGDCTVRLWDPATGQLRTTDIGIRRLYRRALGTSSRRLRAVGSIFGSGIW